MFFFFLLIHYVFSKEKYLSIYQGTSQCTLFLRFLRNVNRFISDWHLYKVIDDLVNAKLIVKTPKSKDPVRSTSPPQDYYSRPD